MEQLNLLYLESQSESYPKPYSAACIPAVVIQTDSR